MALINDIHPSGEHMIRKWDKEHDLSYDSVPLSFTVHLFIVVWPTIYPIATLRPDFKIGVNDQVKNKIDSILSNSNCASDFCGIFTSADRKKLDDIAKLGTSHTLKRYLNRTRLYVAGELVFKLPAYMENNLDIYPNCVSTYKILECDLQVGNRLEGEFLLLNFGKIFKTFAGG